MPEKTTFYGAAKRYNTILKKYGYSSAIADGLTNSRIHSSNPLKVPRDVARFMRMYKGVLVRAGYSEKSAKSMMLRIFESLFR